MSSSSDTTNTKARFVDDRQRQKTEQTCIRRPRLSQQQPRSTMRKFLSVVSPLWHTGVMAAERGGDIDLFGSGAGKPSMLSTTACGKGGGTACSSDVRGQAVEQDVEDKENHNGAENKRPWWLEPLVEMPVGSFSTGFSEATCGTTSGNNVTQAHSPQGTPVAERWATTIKHKHKCLKRWMKMKVEMIKDLMLNSTKMTSIQARRALRSTHWNLEKAIASRSPSSSTRKKISLLPFKRKASGAARVIALAGAKNRSSRVDVRISDQKGVPALREQQAASSRSGDPTSCVSMAPGIESHRTQSRAAGGATNEQQEEVAHPPPTEETSAPSAAVGSVASPPGPPVAAQRTPPAGDDDDDTMFLVNSEDAVVDVLFFNPKQATVDAAEQKWGRSSSKTSTTTASSSSSSSSSTASPAEAVRPSPSPTTSGGAAAGAPQEPPFLELPEAASPAARTEVESAPSSTSGGRKRLLSEMSIESTNISSTIAAASTRIMPLTPYSEDEDAYSPNEVAAINSSMCPPPSFFPMKKHAKPCLAPAVVEENEFSIAPPSTEIDVVTTEDEGQESPKCEHHLTISCAGKSPAAGAAAADDPMCPPTEDCGTATETENESTDPAAPRAGGFLNTRFDGPYSAEEILQLFDGDEIMKESAPPPEARSPAGSSSAVDERGPEAALMRNLLRQKMVMNETFAEAAASRTTNDGSHHKGNANEAAHQGSPIEEPSYSPTSVATGVSPTGQLSLLTPAASSASLLNKKVNFFGSPFDKNEIFLRPAAQASTPAKSGDRAGDDAMSVSSGKASPAPGADEDASDSSSSDSSSSTEVVDVEKTSRERHVARRQKTLLRLQRRREDEAKKAQQEKLEQEQKEAAALDQFLHGTMAGPASGGQLVRHVLRESALSKERLLSYLDGAQRWIDVAMFTLTDKEIEQALIRAAQERDVHVRVILDDWQHCKPGMKSAYERLLEAGIPVTKIYQGKYRAMHHKFVVIDGYYVLLGSLNFTGPGLEANRENVLVLREEHVVRRYLEGFDSLFRDASLIKPQSDAHLYFLAAYAKEKELRGDENRINRDNATSSTGSQQREQVHLGGHLLPADAFPVQQVHAPYPAISAADVLPVGGPSGSDQPYEPYTENPDFEPTSSTTTTTTTLRNLPDTYRMQISGAASNIAIERGDVNARSGAVKRLASRDGFLTKAGFKVMELQIWERMQNLTFADSKLASRWAQANMYKRKVLVTNVFGSRTKGQSSSTAPAPPVSDVLFFPEQRRAALTTGGPSVSGASSASTSKQVQKQKMSAEDKEAASQAAMSANTRRLKQVILSAEKSLDIAMHQLEDVEMALVLRRLLHERPYLKLRLIVDKARLEEGCGGAGQETRTQVHFLREELVKEQKRLKVRAERGWSPRALGEELQDRHGYLRREYPECFEDDEFEGAGGEHLLYHDEEHQLHDEDVVKHKAMLRASTERVATAERALLEQTLRTFRKFDVEIRRSNVKSFERTCSTSAAAPIPSAVGGRTTIQHRNAGKMHHKFVIVDGKTLVTGSFNWTVGARERNMENVVMINAKRAVAAYQEEFELLWSEYEGKKKTEGRLSPALVVAANDFSASFCGC